MLKSSKTLFNFIGAPPKLQTLSDILSKIQHSPQKAQHNLFYGDGLKKSQYFSYNSITLKIEPLKHAIGASNMFVKESLK